MNVDLFKLKKNKTVLDAIGMAYFALRRRANRLIGESDTDLTLEQFIVLHVLGAEEGKNLKDLAEIIDREKTTVTRMIDGLEKRNLVVRIPSREDKRQKLIYLTALGKELCSEMEHFKPILEKLAIRGISNKDIDTTFKVLVKMSENMIKE